MASTITQERGTRSVGWIVYLALGASAIGTYYLLPRAGVAQAVIVGGLNATAALAACRAAMRTRAMVCLVWVSLGVAMSLSTLANVVWFGFPLVAGHLLGFPSLVEVLWLLMYPIFVVVLVTLARQRNRDARAGDALDSAIIIVAGASMMWAFVIAPIVHSSGLPWLAHIVSVAYPTMDLIVFAMLVRLVVGVSGRSPSIRLLLASCVSLLTADLVYALQTSAGTYAFGGVPDVFWMTSYMLMGAAAIHPSAREFPRQAASAGDRLSAGRAPRPCRSSSSWSG
jgi:hypothetical protein